MSGRKTAIVFLLILLSATLVLAYSVLAQREMEKRRSPLE